MSILNTALEEAVVILNDSPVGKLAAEAIDLVIIQRDDLLGALNKVKRHAIQNIELGATGPGYWEDMRDDVTETLEHISRAALAFGK